MSKLLISSDGIVLFECPGCGCSHGIPVRSGSGETGWVWNNSMDKPTFSPSINVSMVPTDPARDTKICHSFVTDGKIRFLPDTTHRYSGQEVELPEIG